MTGSAVLYVCHRDNVVIVWCTLQIYLVVNGNRIQVLDTWAEDDGGEMFVCLIAFVFYGPSTTTWSLRVIT